MSTARDALITALDFEGTGSVQGWPDEPWQIGMIALRQGRVDPGSAFESLLRVGERPFNRYAPGRHAEQRDAMKSAPALRELWPTLCPHLEGAVLAAHNGATETRYLSSAFPLHPPTIRLDTLKLARRIYPGLRSYRLDDLLERLKLSSRVQALAPDRDPHDALYDAAGCAVLLEHILALPAWGGAPLSTLIHAQAPAR